MSDLKKCNDNPLKYINPKTGRCVLSTNKDIQELIRKGKAVPVVVPKPTPVPVPKPPVKDIYADLTKCGENPAKYINPKTGRCVLFTNKDIQELVRKRKSAQVVVPKPAPAPKPVPQPKPSPAPKPVKYGPPDDEIKIIKCGENPDRYINPKTGRCVMLHNKDILEYLKNKNARLVDPKQEKLSGMIGVLDKNQDGYVSLFEYMDWVESKGTEERKIGKYKEYNQNDLAQAFLGRLFSNINVDLEKVACIYGIRFCLVGQNGKIIKYDIPGPGVSCIDKYYNNQDNIMIAESTGDFWLTGAPSHDDKYLEQMKLYYNDKIFKAIEACSKTNHRLFLINFILVSGDSTKNFKEGIWPVGSHANAMIFDLKKKTIERFDPHGKGGIFDNFKIDDFVEKKFSDLFPDYKYIPMLEVCPYLFGPQRIADAFGGMCYTWSIMYMCLRVLNPDTKPDAIVDKMSSDSPELLRNKLLRFHKFIVKTLQDMK